MCAFTCEGIDVDIDVEHEGQKTKVTPPNQDREAGGGEETDHSSADAEARVEGRASPGSKVSLSLQQRCPQGYSLITTNQLILCEPHL